MDRLSSGTEQLLRDIFEHRSTEGACDLTYWKQRFEELEANYSLDVQVRSQFGTLHDENMISVDWADDVPCDLFILDRGFEYYERYLQGGNTPRADVRVFVSYNQKSGSAFADALEKKLEGKALILRDKSKISPWGSISEFMQSIREQDFAVCVITDEYLKSQACMFEVATMMRERDWQSRIMSAVLDTSIYGKKLEYATYWATRKEELEQKAQNVSGLPAIQALAQDAEQVNKISAEISDFLSFVLDSNNPPIYTVLDEIEKRVLATSGKQLIPQELLEQTEFLHIKEALSDFAQHLLVKAGKAEKRIIFMQDLSGYCLGLEGEDGERTSSNRTVALWKDAISELKELKLIEQSDTKGQILRVTNYGYKIADKLEIELLLD